MAGTAVNRTISPAFWKWPTFRSDVRVFFFNRARNGELKFWRSPIAALSPLCLAAAILAVITVSGSKWDLFPASGGLFSWCTRHRPSLPAWRSSLR